MLLRFKVLCTLAVLKSPNLERTPCLKSGTTNDQKLLEAGLYGRAIQSFQAVILLAERGMAIRHAVAR